MSALTSIGNAFLSKLAENISMGRVPAREVETYSNRLCLRCVYRMADTLGHASQVQALPVEYRDDPKGPGVAREILRSH